MLTRRRFLLNSGLLSLAPSVPLLMHRTAHALAPQNDERILVVVQLSGGNDGLNTVVPFDDDQYNSLRPKLRLPKDRLHTIADGLGLHPSMADAAKLFEQQRLSVMQGVGYPNPNRSHDVSMAIWHTARFDPEDHTGNGWLGRSLDPMNPDESAGPSSYFIGTDAVPVALRGRRAAVSSFDSMDDLVIPGEFNIGSSGRTPEANDVASFLKRTAVDALDTSRLVTQILGRAKQNGIAWPTSKLAERLRLISQLIQADCGTRVYYTIQGGYDTHAAQLNAHARLLGDLSRGLKAFLDELAAAGLEDRVLVLCFSEFGRQVQENASLGTDHGTSGPVFIAGSSVSGRIIGEAPNLAALTENAPDYTTDFRQVYATVLDDWLDVPSDSVLGQDWPKLRLFA